MEPNDLGRLPELERLLERPDLPLPEALERCVSGLSEQVSWLRAATAPPELGERIERFGRYTALTLIGRGGMGSVYRAHDPWLQRPVAIKFIRPRRLDDPKAAQRFVLLPPGVFPMGSPPGERRRGDDEDRHQVLVSRGFYVSATEVTNAQFRRFRPEHKTWGYKGHAGDGDAQPAGNVPWEQARAFCQWLSEQEQSPGRYRLPTEAEWEYACRAGTQSAYPWGAARADAWRACNALEPKTAAEFDRTDDSVFPKDDGHRLAAPVGSFQPNAWGLFDMLGNMSEHVSDWYQAHLKGPVKDPVGLPGGADHVLRGGAWNDYDPACRASARGPANRAAKSGWGVRVVRVLPRRVKKKP